MNKRRKREGVARTKVRASAFGEVTLIIMAAYSSILSSYCEDEDRMEEYAATVSYDMLCCQECKENLYVENVLVHVVEEEDVSVQVQFTISSRVTRPRSSPSSCVPLQRPPPSWIPSRRRYPS